MWCAAVGTAGVAIGGTIGGTVVGGYRAWNSPGATKKETAQLKAAEDKVAEKEEELTQVQTSLDVQEKEANDLREKHRLAEEQLKSLDATKTEELRVAQQSVQNIQKEKDRQDQLVQTLRQEAEESSAAMEKELREKARLTALVEAKEQDRHNYPEPAFLQAHLDGTVNIAITGQSGVGKSSLINGLRRVKRGQPGYAGESAGETTMKPTPYSYSSVLPGLRLPVRWHVSEGFRLVDCDSAVTIGKGDIIFFADSKDSKVKKAVVMEPHKQADTQLIVQVDAGEEVISAESIHAVMSGSILWDLPGVGTKNFPKETYVQEMGLRYFDMVLLVTGDRFTEGEVTIMKELDHWNKPFFLVRTKIDGPISKRVADEDEDLDSKRMAAIEEEVKCEVLQYFTLLMTQNPLPADYYIVSTLWNQLSKHDLPKLKEHMVMAFSNSRRIDLDRTCPVCFETYAEYGGEPTARRLALDCGHHFCSDCVPQLQKCAICKAPTS